MAGSAGLHTGSTPQRKQQWIIMVRGGLAFTTCLLNIEGPKLPPPSLCGHSSVLRPGQKDAPAGAYLWGRLSNRKAAPHHRDPADSCPTSAAALSGPTSFL